MLNERNKLISTLNKKVEQLSGVIGLFKQTKSNGDKIID